MKPQYLIEEINKVICQYVDIKVIEERKNYPFYGTEDYVYYCWKCVIPKKYKRPYLLTYSNLYALLFCKGCEEVLPFTNDLYWFEKNQHKIHYPPINQEEWIALYCLINHGQDIVEHNQFIKKVAKLLFNNLKDIIDLTF